MNLAQQRKTIAVSAIVVFALGTIAHAERGELPTARFLIGAGGIFTIISVFTDMGSPIGAGMAIVILITAVLTEGEGILHLLERRGGQRSSAPATAPGKKGEKVVRKGGRVVRVRQSLPHETPEKQGPELGAPFGLGPLALGGG